MVEIWAFRSGDEQTTIVRSTKVLGYRFVIVRMYLIGWLPIADKYRRYVTMRLVGIAETGTCCTFVDHCLICLITNLSNIRVLMIGRKLKFSLTVI